MLADVPPNAYRVFSQVTATGVVLPPRITILRRIFEMLPLLDDRNWVAELLVSPPDTITRLSTDLVNIGPRTYATLVVDDMRGCSGCGAAVGLPHKPRCGVARCLWTGGQRLQCEFRRDGMPEEWLATDSPHAHTLAGFLVAGDDADPDHRCGHDVETGVWPGEEDCERLDLWCRWGPPWIPCRRDHPDATHDLNALRWYDWNPSRLRYDYPTGEQAVSYLRNRLADQTDAEG